jgi:hypothetical protein
MHPLMTTKNVAIAGAAGSFLWLYTLCTFSANEFKSFEYREQEDGSKGYVQVVDVKTHSLPSRLVAAMFLLGFSYTAYKVNGDIEKKTEAKSIKPQSPKASTPQVTLETPALFQADEESEEEVIDYPDIPATQLQRPIYDEPPVVDAPMSVSQEDLTNKVLPSLYHFPKRHLICVAETGAGKTSLLLGLIKTAYNSTAGSVDMYLCTVKDGNWMGLEYQQDSQGNDRHVCVDQVTGKGVAQVMRNLRHCREKLNARGAARKQAVAEGKPKPIFPPIVFVIDEMNTLISAMKKQGCKEDFLLVVDAIASTGREDNLRLWIFGQDYQVQNLGINTGNWGNYGFALLGRIYNDEETGDEIYACEKMEAAFVGRQALFGNEGSTYWEQSLSLIKENKGSAIIWTSLTRQACLMPYLPKIEYETLWEVQQDDEEPALSEAEPEAEDDREAEEEELFNEEPESFPISLALI